MADSRICTVEGCGKKHFSRGFCSAHYTRNRRHGTPFGGGTQRGKPLSFFNEVVVAHKGDECLIWPYGRGDDGYGTLWENGHRHRVHRYACRRVHGAPPTPNHEAAHSCGNGHLGCCSPNHLRWATSKENNADKIGHGTVNLGLRNGMAKLSDDDVREIRRLANGKTHREIAGMFNVRRQSITDIVARKKRASVFG